MPDIDMGSGNVFPSNNGGITQTEHDRNVAQAIEMRENEVYQYQVNINNFEAMIATFADLPLTWPNELTKYKGMGRDQLAAAIVDDDELDVVSRLAFRDELKMRIRSEKMEQRKAKMILATFEAQVTDMAKMRELIAEIKAARVQAAV
jgi:hypothetical protein